MTGGMTCQGEWSSMYLIHHQLNLAVELSGVQFTFSQLSPFPNLITQISFMSSHEMNGRILTCESLIDIATVPSNK